ncbi:MULTISPECIES: hypothetical protein [unclassified Pseudonocardia]|uniref:hypothetical protein n=1 Tax=unclassified Pseudonocardia TaxID=2619320 RepID=UPI00094ACA60|nr:hypothetical protein [Pseudonocardia sp. Ae707_Ps1]OLM21084.1 Translation initiation factor 2 [Pseudonocardia sp. Ae707_Ps1]
MPHQRPPEPGSGDAPRGAAGPSRPAPQYPSGRPVAAPDSPRVPHQQRRTAPSRPPHGGPPGAPPAGGPRPTRVVPGPGAPAGTPPGGHPRTRALPPDGPGDLRAASGPGGPNGPVGGGPGGGGPGGGSGGSGDRGGSPDQTATLKADLSPTKIAAGAGAAIVTAILGSFLGAIGTVLGAALGSIISTLATTLFTRSLEVSRDKAIEIKDKAAAKKGKGVAEGTVVAAGQSSGRGVAGPTGEETVLLDPSQAPAQPSRSAGHGRWRRVRLTRRTVIVSAVLGVLTFAVSMFLITGIEVVKGSSLAGNSSSTSVGSVVTGPAPAPETDDGSGSTDSSDSATSTSESATSTSESSSSTSSTESSQDEQGGTEQQDGSGSSGNPLQDGLSRVLPTQQPDSGSGGSDRSGQSGQGSGGAAPSN